jgi:hypothetical protein
MNKNESIEKLDKYRKQILKNCTHTKEEILKLGYNPCKDAADVVAECIAQIGE